MTGVSKSPASIVRRAHTPHMRHSRHHISCLCHIFTAQKNYGFRGFSSDCYLHIEWPWTRRVIFTYEMLLRRSIFPFLFPILTSNGMFFFLRPMECRCGKIWDHIFDHIPHLSCAGVVSFHLFVPYLMSACLKCTRDVNAPWLPVWCSCANMWRVCVWVYVYLLT